MKKVGQVTGNALGKAGKATGNALVAGAKYAGRDMKNAAMMLPGHAMDAARNAGPAMKNLATQPGNAFRSGVNQVNASERVMSNAMRHPVKAIKRNGPLTFGAAMTAKATGANVISNFAHGAARPQPKEQPIWEGHPSRTGPGARRY